MLALPSQLAPAPLTGRARDGWLGRMLKIASRSLRRRWMTQVGTFVAVALGVALMTVMGLGLAAAAALPPGADVVGLVSLLGTVEAG